MSFPFNMCDDPGTVGGGDDVALDVDRKFVIIGVR